VFAVAGLLAAASRSRRGLTGGELDRAADDPELSALCTRGHGVGAYLTD